MKKSIIFFSTVSALLFATGSVSAQDDKREALGFGLRAGVNFANVYDTEGEDFTADGKVGFAGGAFLSIPIGKFLGVQPEVLFSQKGFKSSGTLLGQPYSLTRTSNWIDVPILLQIKPAQIITIVAGPQFAFHMSNKDTYTWGSNSTSQQEEFDNDNIRKNVLGLSAGIDINVQNFVLSGRGGWDLQNNRGDGSSTTPRYRNSWIQLTLGVRF